MRWGSAAALAVILSTGLFTAANADTDDAHRHYDRDADCAVFDPAELTAERATWDGACARGLATGHGTAVFFTRDRNAETLTADFRGGLAMDGAAQIRWADGARYDGAIAAGRPEGTGVLTNAAGDRFTGDWKDGALNGRGNVVWSNGDRYEGAWRDGRAEGHGVQVWADGQKYDGLWHNDLPNGQGTLTRKDGTQVTGLFVDGKRQPPAVTAAAAPPATMAPSAPSDAQHFFDGFAGVTLTGVDGSTVALTAREGGLLRIVTATDGTVQKAVFAFLGSGLGTVSDAGDPPQVVGFFRVAPSGVEVQYGDGRSETLRRDGADGLAIMQKSAAGDVVCAAWYPQGHAFSADERKAAVAAYARRLGLADAGAPASRPGCAQAAIPVSNNPAPVASPHRKPSHTPRVTAALAPPPSPIPPVTANGLQTVPVKDSTVHLIDTAPVADAGAPPAASVAPSDERIASNCLKVDSDGSYWGFRNHCGYNVQFSYCLLHGADDMTACRAGGAGSVPGSVPANGFGALFADNVLFGRGVEHDFRWVGCRGGAGEVAAHLDEAEPASGRCIRSGLSVASQN
jgi:hypothetical protein